MKKLVLGLALFLTACSTAVEQPTAPVGPASMPTPSGYIQFCNDFPKSVLCGG